MDDLISRLQRRAADPERRTDAPRSMTFGGPGGSLTTMFASLDLGGPVGGLDLGSLVADLGSVVASNQGGRPIEPAVADRVDAFAAGFSTTNPAIAAELPGPAGPAVLDAAERQLGRSLPGNLRRVYGEVANGGFGPGGGLFPIERAVALYLDLRAEPPGPGGRAWPDELLPVRDNDPGFECLDLASGRVIDWNPEELTERSGDRAWRASFTEVATSLEAWLDAWVGSRPPHEALAEHVEASMIEEARRARASIAAMTPDQRAAMGLPEVGWERVVWGGLGLDED